MLLKLLLYLTLVSLSVVGILLGETDGKMVEEKTIRGAGLTLNCSLSPDLVEEIASYSWLTQLLIDNLIAPGGKLKGLTYKYLAEFTDKFGSRIAGSQNFEDSIDYLLNFLTSLNFSNVHGETVMVPVWIRGNETLTMLQPRNKKLALLGLGSSIGTPPDGITAEVIVVRNYTELDERAAEVPGKIVVFNNPYEGYGTSVDYRENGASAASQYGAVAALVRSVTPMSIYSPHTGIQTYDISKAPVKIPVASITVEDAEMFQRMVQRGSTVQLKLYMEAQNLPDSPSRNTIADIVGNKYPEQVVVTGGHLDSWDVGQGAMDDGGGAFVGIFSAYALRALGFNAARTLRSISWASEEQGLVGATQYVQQHADEMDNFILVTESDSGTFEADGFSFGGTDEAACIMQEIFKLGAPLNATNFILTGGDSDTGPFVQYGVPTGAITTNNWKYFLFHHSNGDTMTVENSDQLDSCVALTALMTGVVANLSIPLPRG